MEKWEDDYARQSRYREQITENPYEFGTGINLLDRERLSTAVTTTGKRNTLSHSIDTQSNRLREDRVVLPRIGTG